MGKLDEDPEWRGLIDQVRAWLNLEISSDELVTFCRTREWKDPESATAAQEFADLVIRGGIS